AVAVGRDAADGVEARVAAAQRPQRIAGLAVVEPGDALLVGCVAVEVGLALRRVVAAAAPLAHLAERRAHTLALEPGLKAAMLAAVGGVVRGAGRAVGLASADAGAGAAGAAFAAYGRARGPPGQERAATADRDQARAHPRAQRRRRAIARGAAAAHAGVAL